MDQIEADMKREELRQKRRSSNQRTLALVIALVAIVAGVVIPVWLDKADRQTRGETLDKIEGIIGRMDQNNSKEAREALINAVGSLIGVIACNDLANLDLFADRLETSGWDIAEGDLACLEPPVFDYTPPSSTTTTTPGG